MKKWVIALLSIFILTGCTKEEPVVYEEQPPVEIEFEGESKYTIDFENGTIEYELGNVENGTLKMVDEKEPRRFVEVYEKGLENYDALSVKVFATTLENYCTKNPNDVYMFNKNNAAYDEIYSADANEDGVVTYDERMRFVLDILEREGSENVA